MNWKRYGRTRRDAVSSTISKLSGGTEEHYKHLSQDSATIDLYLKQGLPEYGGDNHLVQMFDFTEH
jgi:hypothetical protein